MISRTPFILLIGAILLCSGCSDSSNEDDADTITNDDDVFANDDDVAPTPNDDDAENPYCKDDLALPSDPKEDPSWVEAYQPNAESLAAHNLPDWYRDAKFGIFIHWGPYSVPAYADHNMAVPFSYAEWYWFFLMISEFLPVYEHHLATYGGDVLYDDFIGMWKAEAFDAGELAELISDSGARYGVLVSKHHDGVALFNNTTTHRDTVNMGPCRDLVGEYVMAMRDRGLKAGIYYSWLEWFHPEYNGDGGFFHIGPLNLEKPALVNPFTGEPVEYRG